MLSFKVSDGTFYIEPCPSLTEFFYVHFFEYSKIDYGMAFIGKLNACIIYCKERQIEYLEREIEMLKSLEEPIVYTEEE